MWNNLTNGDRFWGLTPFSFLHYFPIVSSKMALVYWISTLWRWIIINILNSKYIIIRF